LTYNKALRSAEGTMADSQQAYIELLGLIAADPEHKLDQYLPLSPETARGTTEEWNATEVSIPEDVADTPTGGTQLPTQTSSTVGRAGTRAKRYS
jgi:hypothetical protein